METVDFIFLIYIIYFVNLISITYWAYRWVLARREFIISCTVILVPVVVLPDCTGYDVVMTYPRLATWITFVALFYYRPMCDACWSDFIDLKKLH